MSEIDSIDAFLLLCGQMCEVAKIANKNKKSLSGSNFYGNKFHDLLVEVSRHHSAISKMILASNLDARSVESFLPHFETVKSYDCANTKRVAAFKQLRMFCKSELLPEVENLKANPIPETEQVLPMAVVQGTRGYIEKIVLQANGCYEHGWYDACSVMIRRLIETLIIELYESKSKASSIQDGDGNFFMLSVLIDRTLSEKSWNLGRETKSALPLVKSLGDRAAHNRRYLSKKADLDQVIHGLRVAVDDLIHLSGLL